MYKFEFGIHSQGKREEVQSELRRQINDLKKEIDDCDCEIQRERSKRRGQNQSLISRYENYNTNHRWHIDNLELMMRQIDNHIINPFGLEDLLESVADYIQNYRSSGFIFDNSIYEEFDLTSTTSGPGGDDNDDSNDNGNNGEEKGEKEVCVKWMNEVFFLELIF